MSEQKRWRERPFDPSCKKFVDPDPETTAAIRAVLRNWDGENWKAVKHVLLADIYTLDMLVGMDKEDIQQAFLTGQQRMIQRSGQPATNNPEWSLQVSSGGDNDRPYGVVRVGHLQPDASNAPDAVLDRYDAAILRVLDAANMSLTQDEIEKRLNDPQLSLSARTIGKRLEKLRKNGLTHRPNGDRGGDAITDAGRVELAKIPTDAVPKFAD